MFLLYYKMDDNENITYNIETPTQLISEEHFFSNEPVIETPAPEENIAEITKEVPEPQIEEVPTHHIEEVPVEIPTHHIEEIPVEVQEPHIEEIPTHHIEEVPVEIPTHHIEEIPVEVQEPPVEEIPTHHIEEVPVEVPEPQIEEVPTHHIEEVPVEVPEPQVEEIPTHHIEEVHVEVSEPQVEEVHVEVSEPQIEEVPVEIPEPQIEEVPVEIPVEVPVEVPKEVPVEIPTEIHVPAPTPKIPELVFIIPYRDREQHLTFFKNHMNYVLEDMEPSSYRILYIHQTDKRDFNRGALKNIGFLVLKEMYPNDYHNITLVFNDIDTMPFTKNFINYQTNHGTVKHFYGYKFALGGIVSIKASDFEKTRGFPNLWTWGFEDNELQRRVNAANLIIDRNEFYPIMDKNILQLKDGLERAVNRDEFDRYLCNTIEGFSSIKNLEYNIDDNTGFVNVTRFSTLVENKPETNIIHNIRDGNQPFKQQPKPARRGGSMKMLML